MKKYKTTFLNAAIEEVEVVRETAKQVVFARPRGIDYREAKRSECKNYFDTWSDAHNYLVAGCEKRINTIQRQLSSELKRLGDVEAMVKP
jgi:hypothetical protein